MAMQIVRSVDAFYPSFPIGCDPVAVPCVLSIAEANGKRYLRTPFAMLDAFADDDIERHLNAPGYHRTEAECLAYLRYEYPWAEYARPIMDALESARRVHGQTSGLIVADRIGVSLDAVYLIARGHKRYSIRQVRAAVKALSEPAVA